jgi:carboxymethylenebutenolidase
MEKILSFAGEEFEGYLAVPASGKGPGIVLLQEIFGVNEFMRSVADDYAAKGFTVLCPDLFWRQEPGIQLTDKTDAEWARAFELYKGLDEAKAVEDAAAAMNYLRAHPACTSKVGATGYCLGGKLAYLIGVRFHPDCSVGYYGVGIENALDEAAQLTTPLMLHIASEDQFCSKEAQAKIHAALDGNPLITIHDYAGQDHAFARAGGAHYNAEAAALANQRTLDYLKAHLDGGH